MPYLATVLEILQLSGSRNPAASVAKNIKLQKKNVASTSLYVAYKNKCSSKMLSNSISLKNFPRIPKQQKFHPPSNTST
jgi:hypothetical protein